MSNRDKVERLAKAMGWEWQCDDYDGETKWAWMTPNFHHVHNWNPWENSSDLRFFFMPGLREDIIEKIVKEQKCCNNMLQGMFFAIFAPHIIADAALAVLEGK